MKLLKEKHVDAFASKAACVFKCTAVGRYFVAISKRIAYYIVLRGVLKYLGPLASVDTSVLHLE